MAEFPEKVVNLEEPMDSGDDEDVLYVETITKEPENKNEQTVQESVGAVGNKEKHLEVIDLTGGDDYDDEVSIVPQPPQYVLLPAEEEIEDEIFIDENEDEPQIVQIIINIDLTEDV